MVAGGCSEVLEASRAEELGEVRSRALAMQMVLSSAFMFSALLKSNGLLLRFAILY
jgi:hypothetical protein